MTKAHPWKTLDEAIHALTRRRDVLSGQILALQQTHQSLESQLLIQYVVLRSAKKVADWANAQGLTMPGATGNKRQFSPKDISSLINGGSPTVSAELFSLVQEIFEINSAAADKSFN